MNGLDEKSVSSSASVPGSGPAQARQCNMNGGKALQEGWEILPRLNGN